MRHSKCAVVHCANLSSSSINESFSRYKPLNMLFRFFQFLIYAYFNEAFVSNFMRKLSFNTNVQKSFQDVV